MQKNFPSSAEILSAKKRKKRTLSKIVSLLICAVVCITVYASILPALTLDEADQAAIPLTDEAAAPAPSAERSLSFSGSDFTVQVAFSGNACLPQDVSLSVCEILPDSPDYSEYYAQAEDALPKERGILFCRFFDISFLSDGNEIEPQAPVDVQISYDSLVPQGENLIYNAVHFARDGIEVLPAQIEENEQGNDTISFSQSSFSVVGTAVSSLELDDGSYIFYKDGYALGVNDYGPVAIAVTVDENGYVYPADSAVDIQRITWMYQNNSLRTRANGSDEYLALSSDSLYLSDSPVATSAHRKAQTKVPLIRTFFRTTKKKGFRL